MSPVLSAAYYTRHNTEIVFLLAFIAWCAIALAIHQVRVRRNREWHPYFRKGPKR